MQYQFVGTDPSGRLIYEPVSAAPQPSQCKQAKQGASWFDKWFVTEEGVIEVSLKDMTIVGGFIITGTLVAILIASCNDGTGNYKCTIAEWPMISDVICQEMYNRVFILLTAIFMFGIQQANLRAFYKQLYGKISNGRNDTMFWIGIVSMAALPLIGIFDEKLWTKIHGITAGIFFGCFMLYSRLMGNALHETRAQFPQEEQAAIDSIYKNISGLMWTTLAFGVSIALFGSGGISAILEWATVFYFINFFGIASFANPYYDAVRQPKVPALDKC